MEDKNNNYRIILAIESLEFEDWVASIQSEIGGNFEVQIIRPNSEEKNEVLQKIKVYEELANQIAQNFDKNIGILVSGTGLESSLTLNKFKGIRAALVSTYYLAAMTRLHNKANILIIGSDHTGKKAALQYIHPFITNDLDEGVGKFHSQRVNKIINIEKTQQTSC